MFEAVYQKKNQNILLLFIPLAWAAKKTQNKLVYFEAERNTDAGWNADLPSST